MRNNVEQIKNDENNDNIKGKNNLNNFISNKNIINKEENENENKNKNNKIINHQECKKLLFDKIEDNSSSLQENINENINLDNNKIIENNEINITIQSSSILSDIRNLYGNHLTKNEFIFDYLNTNVLSNLSLPETEKKSQIQNKNIKTNKKPLKNNESLTSNINSTTNISSMEKPIFRCTCKNSNCLKFYCECFANGKFCDNCICINCKNTQENKELRLERYNLIISRNPKAIQKINSTKRSWTCKCRNSNCSKKYCDCFHNGRNCTSKCRCFNCENKNFTIKNNNNKKIKRIRGIKKVKMTKLINRKFKRGKKIKNSDNDNNQNEENNIDKKEKKNKYNKYYTPKKQRNNYDKSNYIFYQNDTTATLTGKKEKRNLFQNKTDKKIKDVYTKLQMDNL